MHRQLRRQLLRSPESERVETTLALCDLKRLLRSCGRGGGNEYLDGAGEQHRLDDAVGGDAALEQVPEILRETEPFDEEKTVLSLIHLGEREGEEQHGSADSTQRCS